MKILLIEPSKAPATIGGEDVFLFEPLALEYLAAGVSPEHEVRILDLRLDKDLPRSYTDFHPDVVGITAYTSHVNVVRRLFEQIKDWDARVLTVVGGHHATVLPEDFLSPCIDLIVMGEGVLAFKELVTRFGKGAPFEGIPGVAFAKEGSLSRTDAQAAVDLDAFPFPDRRLTAKYRKHYYFDFIHTQLPTALPLKEFYAEYHDLYTKGIALSKQLALLRKYPLREIPQLLTKGRRMYHRLKMAYVDYEK